jgi:hypothetical protein
VVRGIGGHGHADRRGDEAARLVGRRLRDHGEHHLPRLEHAHALFAVDELAMRGKNGAHPHEIEIRQMRVAQGHLEAGELFLVPADALGQKGLGRDEHS